MTRPVRLAVKIMDGPYAGRTLLVGNPVPPKLVLPLQGGSKVEYRIEQRPNGLFAFRGGAPAQVDKDLPRIGWRMWGVSIQEPVRVEGEIMVAADAVLLSANDATLWPHDGPLVAECSVGGVDRDPGNHKAPQQECTCGIYAARTFDWLHEKGYGRQVFGLVSGWGRTVEHEQGWRFERAYPLAMVVDQYHFTGSDPRGTAALTHALMGDVLIEGAESPADEPAAMKLAKILAQKYRVPVAVGSVDSAVQLVTRILQTGKVPAWVYTALPPDLSDVAVTKR